MARNLTGEINKVYEPIQSLVIYKSKGNDYYIESHKIYTNGENKVFGAGSPLTEEEISNMVEYFKERTQRENSIKGEIPENLLYANWQADNKTLMWYNPGQLRPMFFTKDLAIPNGQAWQPGLIYVVTNKSLDVYAYLGTKRPTAKTILYQAPYHNVSNDGSVCLGSASISKPKELTYSSVIMNYELLFWASEFSHLAGSENPIKGNLNTFWKEAIRTKKGFDASVLIQNEQYKTFQDLLKAVSR